ncbi:MAG: hypothetical protein RIB53_00350 [Roseitalea porphyridii]|jgi:hypothetical protein|uniref:hypothetical protein n=1 Tax=Alphaproteobacteria TaxID=28211 RepID=UPI0032EDB2D4
MAYKANDTRSENVTLGALTGSLRDYKAMTGTNMLSRTDGFFDWQEERRRCDLWPYAKSTATAPKTHCAAKTD